MKQRFITFLVFFSFALLVNAQAGRANKTRKTTPPPVLKYNAGTWKEPYEIPVTKGEEIKEALKEKWGEKIEEDTSNEIFDVLHCPDIINSGMCYYWFFSKGFKNFYANASLSKFSQRDYDDAIFKNRSNKSFKQQDSYKATYRVKNKYGYVHYILNRDEYLYERYLSGGSKYYCTEISIFDYTSDCNTISKPKTTCAIIQATVELMYLQAAQSKQREGLSY